MTASTQKTNNGTKALDFATFLRKYEQRAQNVMWLLGAGASRASGIKTAGDMIWDFKARLYRSDKGVPASAVSDLGDSQVRARLQKYFDSKGSYPAVGAEQEYARYFEETYPDAQDRRRYIDKLVLGAKPSFGHFALAHLLKRDYCRIVWTTNFDKVFEDAVTKVFETSSVMTVGDLGEPERVRRAFTQQRWPLYAKLHGDFHSDALKNTTDELSIQDEQMRNVLLDACRNQGLAVAGYSGRDESVMTVLQDALDNGSGFPNGLFWFVREEDDPYAGVVDLISNAKSSGIDADFIKAESFDELFSDIIRYLPQTEGLAIELDDRRRVPPRKIDLSNRTRTAPFVRTNAVPILEYPQTCRLVDCKIGGAAEVQQVLSEAGSNLLAARSNKGVLAFGDDGEIKRVFANHDIKELDTHGILADRLKFESGERSLLRDALFTSLSAFCGMPIQRERHRRFFRADCGNGNFGLKNLEDATTRIHGQLSTGGINWSEACGVRLDYRMDRLWLLLNPFVAIDITDDVSDENSQRAREFVRERRVQRYNATSNQILDGWISAILGGESNVIELRFEGGTGIGAGFKVLPVTGFSGLER